MNFILTGIGAGLVSALLTVVVVKATPLAAVLYLLAPLPILIVVPRLEPPCRASSPRSSAALAHRGRPVALSGLAFAS